jgi:hypothetical protein
MNVNVVYDLGGAGRVAGVFRSSSRADKVVAVNPAYYRSTICRLEQVSEAAFDWLKSMGQREKLEKPSRLRAPRPKT